MTAVRDSLLRSIRERVNELPRLIDALDMETVSGPSEEIDRLTREVERLSGLLCVCPFMPPEYFEPDEECPVHGDPEKSLTMRAALRWRTAFESLHARILRDLPGDGSEIPQPEDPFWAAQLDELVAYAHQLYLDTEGAN